MDRPDHIRNPIEWGFDQIRFAALTLGSLGRSVRGSEDAPLPAVSRIKAADRLLDGRSLGPYLIARVFEASREASKRGLHP
jgi:hypothetical protein